VPAWAYVLLYKQFDEELLKLLGEWVEPRHVSREDLGLQLHAKGLANPAWEGSHYTIEDIRQAVKITLVKD
jgi:hypothetical protein